MHKIRKLFLPFSLTVVASISLLLSYLVWISPVNLTSKSMDDGVNLNQANKKKISDIYAPTSVNLNLKSKNYQLSSGEVDIADVIKKQLLKWNYGNLLEEKFTEGEYANLLKQDNALILSYPTDVSVGIFEKGFGLKTGAYQNKAYNRILVSLKRKEYIYLLNDKKKTAYAVRVSKRSDETIKKTIFDKNIIRNESVYKLLGGKYVNFYKNDVMIEQYSYILNKESIGLFVTQLLGSNKASQVTSHEQDGVVTYSDGNDKRITISKEGLVTYVDYSVDTRLKKAKFNDYLLQGYFLLNRIGTTLEDVNITSYNPTNHRLSYNYYIGGYPVFMGKQFTGHTIQLSEKNGKRMEFSIYDFQIPIPSAAGAIKLPPTQNVIDRLISNGYSKENIRDIKIGYLWRENSSNEKVSDLIPTYFVKIGDRNWEDYKDLIGIRSEKNSEF